MQSPSTICSQQLKKNHRVNLEFIHFRLNKLFLGADIISFLPPQIYWRTSHFHSYFPSDTKKRGKKLPNISTHYTCSHTPNHVNQSGKAYKTHSAGHRGIIPASIFAEVTLVLNYFKENIMYFYCDSLLCSENIFYSFPHLQKVRLNWTV